VLTSAGLQTYKKITQGLVMRWVSFDIIIYHAISSDMFKYLNGLFFSFIHEYFDT
jgi:hypothetical protein